MDLRTAFPRSMYPTELVADTDTISDEIDDRYLTYLAARHALRLAYKRLGKTREEIPEWLTEAIAERDRFRVDNNHPLVDVRSA